LVAESAAAACLLTLLDLALARGTKRQDKIAELAPAH
jgi:hypothetical protein